jgi:hypothetical protein
LIVTQQELELPRTAAEMLPWVDQTAKRFNTKKLRAEAREAKHFSKELVGEARPIALFAHRYYAESPDVLIQHVLGNQNYDAIVTDSRPTPDITQFIEATTTLMSYEDSLRMELLTAQGHAPAYGRVTAMGPRHKRLAVTADGIAHEHSKIRSEHLQRVQSAVANKATKPYRPNTALVVAVDDSVPFRYAADQAALGHLALSVLVPMLAGKNFCLLALEGSRELHLCYRLP